MDTQIKALEDVHADLRATLAECAALVEELLVDRDRWHDEARAAQAALTELRKLMPPL